MDPSHGLSEVLSALQQLVKDVPALTETSAQPVLPASIPSLPEPRLAESISTDAIQTASTHLAKHVLPHLNLSSLSPNYYGFVTGGATPAALLGDFLTSIFDQNLSVHLPKDTIATNVEVAALNLLIQLLNLPEEEWAVGKVGQQGGGTFTTGATASNVLGLALGREFVLRKAVEKKTGKAMSCGEHGIAEMLSAGGIKKIQVLSTLPHSSIVKAAGIIGIGRANVISISKPNDPLEIDLDRLLVEAQKPDIVSILSISSGEVNTGHFATHSLSTLQEIRKICTANSIWIHADGAFGLFARTLMGKDDSAGSNSTLIRGVEGLELVDSITGDGHKLLNVPYDCGFFFTRHGALSSDVFQNGNAAYLRSDNTDGIASPLNIGLENSRRFRALPVYATLIAYGREGYVDMLKRQINLSRRLVEFLAKDERYEVLPAAESVKEQLDRTFMVVLFRAKDDAVNKDLVKMINATGKMYVSATVWDGKPATRIAVSNWRVDVERDAKLVEAVLDQVAGAS